MAERNVFIVFFSCKWWLAIQQDDLTGTMRRNRSDVGSYVHRSVYLRGTCEEPHGDPGQSTRNAALDPLERADHLAVHGAAAEPGPVHAADDARSRDLGGDFWVHHHAAEQSLGPAAAPTQVGWSAPRRAGGAD